MKKIILISIAALMTSTAKAQPNIAEILMLGKSLVQISTELPDGRTGKGSGVVVSNEYVATNCHVIANTKGINIAKYQNGYQPIAVKADWKHDLCLLKFDGLPFPPVKMRDSATLKYEEPTLSLGYPAGNNVPQPSYGSVKAVHDFDGGQIIRTSSAFAMGSSGGALFDRQSNLIGITTFKSPGANGFFYNLPVDWIKKLIKGPELQSLNTNEVPFWALPLDQRPYFMQVVIPFQNQNWAELKTISTAWTQQEPKSPDAWYFLGLAEEGAKAFNLAKQYFTKAYELNSRDLDAMVALSRVAYQQGDLQTLEKLQDPVNALDQEQGDLMLKQINTLKNL